MRVRVLRVNLVARQLLAYEQVVRLVVVESLDHVIAVAPHRRPIEIALVSARVGIVRQIEPMTPPALAVVRRGQQLVDELIPGARILVVDEGLHFLRRRRQPGQVEVGAANQGAPVGLLSGDQSLPGDRLVKKGVNRVRCRARQGRLLRRLERPTRLLFRQDRPLFKLREVIRRRSRRAGRRFRQRRPFGDPGADNVELVALQFAARRHGRRVAADHLPEQTGIRVARRHCRALRAAAKDRFARTQV